VRVPRAGQVKPPVQERLSDRIAIGVLTSTFPPDLIDRVVAESGRTQQRERLLPARVVVWLVLAMALFSGQAYEDVAWLLAGGLGWARRWQQWWRVPSTPAIAKARARLGAEPLRRLFVEVARPLATPDTTGAWYRGWRLLAVDGTTLDVADTPANAAAFGRPGSGRGEDGGAFPQVRVVAVAEAAPTRSSTRRWGRWPRGRRPWPPGCWGKTAPSGRGCCCWPTGCSSTPTCGARRPPPARSWCGAPGPTRCCRCWSCSQTGRT
jgi:hypothetical protein